MSNIRDRSGGGSNGEGSIRFGWHAPRMHKGLLQDDREGISSEHCRLPTGQELSRPPGMHGIKRVFVHINDKNFAQTEPPISRVMVASTRFKAV